MILFVVSEEGAHQILGVLPRGGSIEAIAARARTAFTNVRRKWRVSRDQKLSDEVLEDVVIGI
jgi:hypothetical protein